MAPFLIKHHVLLNQRKLLGKQQIENRYYSYPRNN